MIELFLAICAFTTLECTDVTLAFYTEFDSDTFGAAGYDIDGNYYILINPEVQDKSEQFWQQLMVHEVAHLVAFEVDKNNTSHFGIYEEICEDLKQLTGTKGRTTCEPYHTRPPYPWRSVRRE